MLSSRISLCLSSLRVVVVATISSLFVIVIFEYHLVAIGVAVVVVCGGG